MIIAVMNAIRENFQGQIFHGLLFFLLLYMLSFMVFSAVHCSENPLKQQIAQDLEFIGNNAKGRGISDL